jgi:hypothetical protein
MFLQIIERKDGTYEVVCVKTKYIISIHPTKTEAQEYIQLLNHTSKTNCYCII